MKNDDHKCLPTIIKLRIFIVNNQSLKLNDKQTKTNNTENLTNFVTSLIKLSRRKQKTNRKLANNLERLVPYLDCDGCPGHQSTQVTVSRKLLSFGTSLPLALAGRCSIPWLSTQIHTPHTDTHVTRTETRAPFARMR